MRQRPYLRRRGARIPHRALPSPSADIKDIHSLKGVQSWSHGPYLDDWSKVPSDIAAKYNTSPTFVPSK